MTTQQLTLDLGYIYVANPRRTDYERLVGSTVRIDHIHTRCHPHCVTAKVIDATNDAHIPSDMMAIVVETPCDKRFGVADKDIKIHTVHPGRQITSCPPRP